MAFKPPEAPTAPTGTADERVSYAVNVRVIAASEPSVFRYSSFRTALGVLLICS
jgi:hypothetical protein